MNPYVATLCIVQGVAQTAGSPVVSVPSVQRDRATNNNQVWHLAEVSLENVDTWVPPAGHFLAAYTDEHARVSNAFGRVARFKPGS